MRIKEVLKEKKITQVELAEKMDVSISAVRQMVVAESLTTTTLNKIATALNVPIWQLFVSPEEVSKESGAGLHCPVCGAELELKQKEDTPQSGS